MTAITRLSLKALIMAAITISPLSLEQAFAQPFARKEDRPVGLRVFLSTGCGACHRIAGTEAEGKIGPDLTHLASRGMIGANLLPLSPENLAEWIGRTQELKPGARMPSFGMLPVSETTAIVDYLMSLE